MQPRRIFSVIYALCVLSAAACEAQGSLSPESSVQSEVRLTVTANQLGGEPRTFEFVAEIAGGADNEPSLYCQATTWEFGDGPGLTVTPSCAPYSPETRITRRFAMKHSYSEPGTYDVTFVYGPLRAQRTVQVP